MVLVDSSVWIRFLSNRAPHAQELEALLEVGEVVGHELVYGELLMGDRGARRKLLASYERMYRAKIVAHHEVVEFVLRRDLRGRGAGWLGVHLLASALVGHFQLWTADSSLSTLASELGVAYGFAGSAQTGA